MLLLMNFDYVDIKVCGNSAMPRINITTIIKFPSSTVKLAKKKNTILLLEEKDKYKLNAEDKVFLLPSYKQLKL